jgi:serine/threonine-protein kinase ULK/ATG1
VLVTADCPVAIKAIDMARISNEIHQILLQSEIECLKKFSRAQHVIQFMDVHATRNNTYIMTEFCEEGDLAKLINPQGMPEAQAVSFMKQVVSGYLEIYRKGIIHRDLKPANIFIKGGLLKIADFGFAVRADDCKKSNKYNIGSPLYMPPEALLYNQYSFKSDIWALGIIFYELLTGVAPWNAKTEKELANKIMSESIFRLMPDNLSPESVDFLTRTLVCSINDRMAPEELRNFSFSPKDERFAITQSIAHKTTSILRSSNRVSTY